MKREKKCSSQGLPMPSGRTCHTILKSSADYFLILSGDQLYNINFQNMVAFAQEKQADLTIASIPVPEKEAHRMGILKIDQDCKVVDFVEKTERCGHLGRFQLGR